VTRRPLDAELVRRGLTGSRAEAREAVEAGIVQVAGIVASTPATMVADDAAIALLGASPPFVSRAGSKLDAALERFAIDPTGWRCLDAGASTGGFTDALLQRGANRVVSVDVGYGQLAWELRTDPRVTVLERTNVRDLTPEDLSGPVDLVVADLSFISLRVVLPALRRLAAPTAPIVVLVKPQFEAEKGSVGKGGVVRDPDVWTRVLEDVVQTARTLGLGARAAMASPLRPGGGRRRGSRGGRRGRCGNAMSHVAFVVHEGRAAAVAAAAALQAQLEERGVACDPAAAGPIDLVITVGGDGTFLRGAHTAAQLGVPVLGVKVGRLGFLTEVDPEEAATLVMAALAGAATIEERLAVVADPRSGVEFEEQWGLNEVMVEKRARHRLVRLRVDVDGEYVTTFSADGVIVATPTGSTAYSFSARGPIVSPSVDGLVVTPVAPHMVFDRSIVLHATQQVTLEVVGDEPGLLSADGRATIELPVGAAIRIRASDRPARFVRRSDAPGFLARVREKFDLSDEPTDVSG
jgi:23S rRNA (cytidine1920-2'-O)/16S rRNA (cytidine1409-2'-O)-methyltransferase